MSDRQHAADLQARLGVMVQDSGEGYAIIDYAALDKLAAWHDNFKRQLRLGTEDVRRERDEALAECERLRERAEQSEAELRKIGLARQEYERAMAECERLRAALGEPCAECGHIDWREFGEADGE